MRLPQRQAGAIVVAALVFAALGLAPRLAHAESVPVSIDVSQLSDAGYERIDGLRLEERLTVRLVQEGFAVVAPGQEARLTLVYRDPDALAVGIVVPEAGLERLVDVSGGEDLDALHLELAQRSVELIRQAARSLPAEAEPEPEREPEPVMKPVPPPIVPDPPAVAFDVSAGLLYRGAGDAQLALGIRYPLWRPLVLTSTLTLIPASSEAIEVVEWQGRAGLGISLFDRETVQLSLGVEVGVLVHQYQGAGDSGTRSELVIALPIDYSRAVSESLSLGLRVAPGFAARAREHVEQGMELWRRSRVHLAALLLLRYQL